MFSTVFGPFLGGLVIGVVIGYILYAKYGPTLRKRFDADKHIL